MYSTRTSSMTRSLSSASVPYEMRCDLGFHWRVVVSSLMEFGECPGRKSLVAILTASDPEIRRIETLPAPDCVTIATIVSSLRGDEGHQVVTARSVTIPLHSTIH